MKFSKLSVMVAVFAASCLPSFGQSPDDLPHYQPKRQVSGVIRSWGHGYLRKIMGIWEEGFKKYHPDVRFEDTMVSSASAMAGLYSGRADIGVLAREITPPEVAAYEKITRQKITPVTVLVGSVGNQDKIMAMGVFVNRDNPVSQLSFSQVEAIFGSERRMGAKENIRTWGQLSPSGQKSDRPIHLFSGLAWEAPGFYISQTVMKGSVLWNDNLVQYDNVEDDKARYVDAYQKVVDSVGADKDAIGLAGAGYSNPNAKLVALSVMDGGPYVAATRENIAALTYPLARPVRFYIHNGPAIPADPRIVEFMRFILSREGQKLVETEGDFLPLPAATVRSELSKLP